MIIFTVTCSIFIETYSTYPNLYVHRCYYTFCDMLTFLWPQNISLLYLFFMMTCLVKKQQDMYSLFFKSLVYIVSKQIINMSAFLLKFLLSYMGQYVKYSRNWIIEAECRLLGNWMVKSILYIFLSSQLRYSWCFLQGSYWFNSITCMICYGADFYYIQDLHVWICQCSVMHLLVCRHLFCWLS